MGNVEYNCQQYCGRLNNNNPIIGLVWETSCRKIVFCQQKERVMIYTFLQTHSGNIPNKTKRCKVPRFLSSLFLGKWWIFSILSKRSIQRQKLCFFKLCFPLAEENHSNRGWIQRWILDGIFWAPPTLVLFVHTPLPQRNGRGIKKNIFPGGSKKHILGIKGIMMNHCDVLDSIAYSSFPSFTTSISWCFQGFPPLKSR